MTGFTDQEIFGGSRTPGVDMSPLERAMEGIAEGARSDALAQTKATIEDAAARFERVAETLKERNSEIVAQAVKTALAKITDGARVDTDTIKEIVGTIKMPDLGALSGISKDLERVKEQIEGIHGTIAGSIRAMREEVMAAIGNAEKAEAKVEQEERPLEWHFDIEYDENGDPKHITARAGDKAPPRTALEAARKAA
jgi:hypothetical protein